MKKLLKIVLFGFIGLVVCGYGLYRYKLNEYYKLGEKNEKYIKEKVFAKDSENRGYSDEAKRQMDEDLEVLNYDPIAKAKVRRVYELSLIQERKNVLSNSQKEYLDGYVRWSKLFHCVSYLSENKYFFNNLFKNMHPDGERMSDLLEIVDQKYTKRLSYDEKYDLINSFATEEECEAFANE